MRKRVATSHNKILSSRKIITTNYTNNPNKTLNTPPLTLLFTLLTNKSPRISRISRNFLHWNLWGEQVFVNPDPDYNNTCYIDDVFSVQEQNQIEVYPTLCSKNELINIETPDFIKDIQLFDVFGREVSIVKNQTSENHWQMNVPNCVRGIYFIKITLKNGDYHEKITTND